MPKVVIPSKSHLSSANVVMSSTRSNSSSKDIDAISPSLLSPCSVLLESSIPPRVDVVDLVLEDKGDDLEEDSPMDKENPMTEPKFMMEDSSKDSYEESH